MKKCSLILLLGTIVCLLLSCENGRRHPDLIAGNPHGGSVYFFQFPDSTFMNKILVRGVPLPYQPSKYYIRKGRFKFPCYPKNLEGQSLFGELAMGVNEEMDYMYGDFYTLEDLVKSPKYIALKGGYYISYPFTTLAPGGTFINAEWEDLLTINLDTVEVYSKVGFFFNGITERKLVELTKKSTMHFKGKSDEMITIDDVVEVLNEIIETNTIKEHCYGISWGGFDWE